MILKLKALKENLNFLTSVFVSQSWIAVSCPLYCLWDIRVAEESIGTDWQRFPLSTIA